MKKFLLLLLALIAATLLGYYCTYKMNASAVIEKDIRTRSQAALDHQDMSWVNLSVDGRDITLTGTAPSEAAKKAADQVVRIFGYNIIHNQLKIDPASFDVSQSDKIEKKIDQTDFDKNESSQQIKQSLSDTVAIIQERVEDSRSQKIGSNANKETIAQQAENCQNKFNQILKTPIHFNSSSAVIRKSSYSVLHNIALTAKECTHFNFQIHGHTDSTGDARLNKKLSQARADAVMKYLISKKIDDKRLTALGHGSDTPVASNRTKAGRNKNRRIEITVEDKQ